MSLDNVVDIPLDLLQSTIFHLVIQSLMFRFLAILTILIEVAELLLFRTCLIHNAVNQQFVLLVDVLTFLVLFAICIDFIVYCCIVVICYHHLRRIEQVTYLHITSNALHYNVIVCWRRKMS